MKLLLTLLTLHLITISYTQNPHLFVEDNSNTNAIHGKSLFENGRGVFAESTGTEGIGLFTKGSTGLISQATRSDRFAGSFSGGLGIRVTANQGLVGIVSSQANFGSVLTLQNTGTGSYLGAVNFSSMSSTFGQIAYRIDGHHRMSFRLNNVDTFMVLHDADNHIVMSNGATLTSGGVWTDACSLVKKNLKSLISGNNILLQISQLPIYYWSYKKQPNEHHIGPMAEDFHGIFGTGNSDKNLASIDLGGVSIAAIQALIREKEAMRDELRKQQEQITELQEQIALMKEATASNDSTEK